MPLLFSLVFNDFSIWWLIPCFALGFVYAWVFYQKSLVGSPLLKKLLFTLRWFAVGLLAFTLLSPLVKTVKLRLQKPVIFIAQDASSSVLMNAKKFDATLYHQNLKDLANQLREDYDVKPLSFSDVVKSGFNFKETGKQTDISSVLNYIDNQNSSNNIGALIIATDGIYNKGANPIVQTQVTPFPIYTVALGDTVPKRDLILMQPTYNQLVYLGNSHEIEVSIKAFGAKGSTTNLKLNTNDGQFKQQSVSFVKDEEVKTLWFVIDANKKGVQKITLDLMPLANEVSSQNNRHTIYVDVLDGREKILLVADAPHPDVSAIKQAIESNKNYEVSVAFADDLPKKTDDFGLVILHNLPSKTRGIGSFLEGIEQKNKWFIIGMQTNVAALSGLQSLLDISSGNIQNQNYDAIFNPDFYAFSLTAQTKNQLSSLPPLVAPFGSYKLKSAAKMLFMQQIADVKTTAPLLVFGESGNHKTAILTGEGIWRWRMGDFEKNNNLDAFNELISKSVQYLSAKEDKRKFRVNHAKNRYLENETVLLNAELYNDAYELVNKPEASLELKNREKKFSYVFSRVGNAYQLNLSTLPVGEYDFYAQTKLGSKKYSANGSFLVEALKVESMETTANHQLLFSLSKSSGGEMVFPKDMMSLVNAIKQNEKVKTISHHEKSYEPLINSKWIFALIILLVSFEWFLRKRNGAV